MSLHQRALVGSAARQLAGNSLISLSDIGERASFRVYAAGALVAESGGGGTFWHVADPVGGTKAKLWVWNNQTQVEYERSEPLGQSITLNAPPEDGFENYSAYKGNVGEPEWQCEIPKSTYGSFSEMPWHCQRNAVRLAGTTLPYEDEDEVKYNIITQASSHGLSSEALDMESSDSENHISYSTALDSKWPPKRRKKRPTLKRSSGKKKPLNPPIVNSKTEKDEVPFDPRSSYWSELDPPSKDSGDLGSSLFHTFKMFNLLQQRVKILGFSEDQTTRIIGSLLNMVLNQTCVAAFRRAHLSTPAEIIRDRGLVYAPYEWLRTGEKNKALGITDAQRALILSSEELSSTATTVVGLSGNPVYTFLRDKTFAGVDYSFEEALVHEGMHLAGVTTHPFHPLYFGFTPRYGHDLYNYPNYDDIVTSCTPPGK